MFNPQFTGAGKTFCLYRISPPWVRAQCWGKAYLAALGL
jgi:hypothetical protein